MRPNYIFVFFSIFILAFHVMATDNKSEATSAEIKNLTLEDSLSLGLRAATPVLKAQQDQELGSTFVLQSYLQFLPNLSTQAAYSNSKGTVFLTTATPTLVNGSSYGANYSVSTALNIFNGFADVASWSAAHERRNAADKTLARAKQQISLDIAQAFLQTILDRHLVEIAEKNLAASLKRQNQLTEQTLVGVRTKSDLFRQQAQTSTDETFLIISQNKQQTDLILLLRKLRINPADKYQLVEPPLEDQLKTSAAVEIKADEKEMIQRAFENRQDYQVAQHTAQALKSDVTIARATYFPKIDFVASYLANSRRFESQNVAGVDLNLGNQASLQDQLNSQGSYFYGVSLTWSLFDRWSGATTVEKAKATAFKAELDRDDYRLQIIGEVKQAINDFSSSHQQLQTSEKGLIAAKKAFEVAEGRYEVGSLNYVDLALTQTSLVQAEASRAQALIGYQLQKRALDFALGITPTE